MMLKKWIVLLFSIAFVLVSCHAPVFNQTEGNIADQKIRASKEFHKADNLDKPLPPLLIKQGSYVDTTPINLQQRPSWLENHIVIRGDQLPFSYYSRLISAGAGSNVLTKYQPNLDSSIKISMSYSGTVRGALDLLASRAGYVYSISNNFVFWQAFVTRTFDIAFMPGDSDYLIGEKAGDNNAPVAGGASYTAGGSEYSSLGGKISIWKDLADTIGQLLTKEGKLTVSQATTSVTVRDRPANVQLVGQYVANLNHNLSKQVLIKVQVLSIELESGFNYGINWNIIAKGFNHSPFTFNANYGTPISIQALNASGGTTIAALPTIGTLGNGIQSSWTILLNALNQQGKTSIVTEPRVLCMNNQVGVIKIVNSQGYLASIQNTSTPASTVTTSVQSNSVTSQVTPGTVTTGLILYILPKILKDKVYLSVNADLSVLNQLGQFGPTSSQIQLPNVSQKHFNQRGIIRSGDTLILSGFKQVTNRTGAVQFLTSQSMGGTAAEQVNSETVVLITPIILHGSA